MEVFVLTINDDIDHTDRDYVEIVATTLDRAKVAALLHAGSALPWVADRDTVYANVEVDDVSSFYSINRYDVVEG